MSEETQQGTNNVNYNNTNLNTITIGNSISSQKDNPSTSQTPQATQDAQAPQQNMQMPGSLPSDLSYHAPNYFYNPASAARQVRNDGTKRLMKVLAIVLGVILILCLFSVVCCFTLNRFINKTNTLESSNTSKTKSETSPQNNSVSATPTPNNQPPIKSTYKYKVGEKIMIDGLEITVEEVRDDVIVKSPKEGKKYIAVLIYVKNVDAVFATVSKYDFNLRTQDDALYPPSFVDIKEPALNLIQIENDAAVRGWVTYEIPAEVKGLTLTYTSFEGSPTVRVDLGL